MFKITLPCSGKVTDEVDVQILINILGYVDDSQDSSSLSSSSILDEQQQQQADQFQAQLASAESMMQSDQASEQSGKRLVSHTLAIKRKKICTVNPVPVQHRVSTLAKSQPPTPVPHTMDWSTQAPPQQVSVFVCVQTLKINNLSLSLIKSITIILCCLSHWKKHEKEETLLNSLFVELN